MKTQTPLKELAMYVGLDIGTSSVKAVLMDGGGVLLASASHPLEVSRPHPLWSEQDPQAWWEASVAAMDKLARSHPAEMAAVAGIGLSGQMHGAVLLNAQGAVLRPAILWNDGRAHAECVAMEAAVPELHAIAGNLAMPGFTAPKLLWVKNHEPDIFAQIATVLLPKAYVRYRLSGALIEEMSDAAGTLWLDVAKRDWSDRLLAATGLTRAHMPALVEGTAAASVLTADLATRWGMKTPPVIAGGAGDNAATALGLGAIAAGDGFLSLGTSGVLFAATDRFAPNPASAVHAFCHALPGTWHQMGVMLSAASCLSWLAHTLGADEATLLAEVGETVSGPADVQFLPYLSGERTPHNDAEARGAFVGLSHSTTRATLTQAVLEGVAYGFRDMLTALSAAGTTLHDIDIVGGGSRSGLWAAILANVLTVTVHRLAEGDVGAALGAARLGRMAATGDSPTVVCTRPARVSSDRPDPARVSAYATAYEQWSRLYPALTRP